MKTLEPEPMSYHFTEDIKLPEHMDERHWGRLLAFDKLRSKYCKDRISDTYGDFLYVALQGAAADEVTARSVTGYVDDFERIPASADDINEFFSMNVVIPLPKCMMCGKETKHAHRYKNIERICYECL